MGWLELIVIFVALPSLFLSGVYFTGRVWKRATRPLDNPPGAGDQELRLEMDEMQHRIVELEERMDMADRLLAAQKRQNPLT